MVRQDFINKSILLILLLGIISFGVIGGCNNNGQSTTDPLTENDFIANTLLSADPERGIVVQFLESPNSEIPENDSGTLGVDEFPLKYEKRIEHTFCWEDDNNEAAHFMELSNSAGDQVLRVDVNGDCVTEVIDAGEYTMSLHHDGKSNATRTIFAIADSENLELAQRRSDFVNRFMISMNNIMKHIRDVVLNDAIAQDGDQATTRFNTETLIVTGRCIGCNLLGASLGDQDLSGVDLSGADLRFSSLERTKLIGARLVDADLREAVMFLTDFTDANLIGADFRNTSLFMCDLPGADLTDAKFRRADLEGVDLTGAVLNGTDFRLATWCDGSCRCSDNQSSIGMCDGCQSVDICVGDEADVPPLPPPPQSSCEDDLDCPFPETCIDGACCTSGEFTFCEFVQDCSPDNCEAPFSCDESQGDNMCCVTEPPNCR